MTDRVTQTINISQLIESQNNKYFIPDRVTQIIDITCVIELHV
jgi:hypothetical protein